MRIKDAIHGSELQSFLARDLKNRVLASPSLPGPHSQPRNGSVSTAKAKEWLHAAQEAADEVGRMPPQPPTFRARAGAAVVQLVRRMVFWLTPQINSANQAMLSVIQEQTSLIDQLAAQVDSVKAQLNDVSAGQYRMRERLDSEIARTEEQLLSSVRSSDATLEATRAILEKQILQLRTLHFANERRVNALRGPGDEPLNAVPENALVPRRTDKGDSLYLMLEDQFRGTREDIKSRLAKYLPYLQPAEDVTTQCPVLDLGCGRGEWLELLRENGLKATGVDLNATFVSYCQELGLDVTLGDVIADLQQRPDNSLTCISSFHLVEHLPWPALVDLVDAVVRVLKPGGIVILETPNPENVQVGSKNFYFDPTHKNPIPPLLLKFLLDARGFADIEILHIHPYPESMRVPDDGQAITQRFNEFFYGPQDYAVIGRKP